MSESDWHCASLRSLCWLRYPKSPFERRATASVLLEATFPLSHISLCLNRCTNHHHCYWPALKEAWFMIGYRGRLPFAPILEDSRLRKRTLKTKRGMNLFFWYTLSPILIVKLKRKRHSASGCLEVLLPRRSYCGIYLWGDKDHSSKNLVRFQILFLLNYMTHILFGKESFTGQNECTLNRVCSLCPALHHHNQILPFGGAFIRASRINWRIISFSSLENSSWVLTFAAGYFLGYCVTAVSLSCGCHIGLLL